jgi:hypothetical protein
MYRKLTETRLKKYYFTLLGKELYCYRRQDDDHHRRLYNLSGLLVDTLPSEVLDENNNLYPFELTY